MAAKQSASADFRKPCLDVGLDRFGRMAGVHENKIRALGLDVFSCLGREHLQKPNSPRVFLGSISRRPLVVLVVPGSVPPGALVRLRGPDVHANHCEAGAMSQEVEQSLTVLHAELDPAPVSFLVDQPRKPFPAFHFIAPLSGVGISPVYRSPGAARLAMA